MSYSRAEFSYDGERDLYICPGGKELKTSGTVHDGTTLKYIAKPSDCSACPLKPHCTTGRERRVQRDVNQEARDYVQSLMGTDEYWDSAINRKQIERLFGELTGILWRKRRLRLAESAAHMRGLAETLDPFNDTVKAALAHLDATGQSGGVIDAIRATAEDTADEIRDMEEDEAMTARAFKLLGSRRNDAYEAALAALREDTRGWWEGLLTPDPDDLNYDEDEDDGEPATADAGSLRGFLEREVLPWYANRSKELANRPLIREQAFGDALDVGKLERLGRYEVHLDRKLEKMLGMLYRLKDLRRE